MTSRNNTKHTLVVSLLSLLICVAMLVGTTFAWFTDSVKSGNNKIVAGNLDVALYHGADLDKPVTGETADLFTDVNGDPIHWEPGVVAYENFKVVNEGSLALKYEFSLLVNGFNTVKDSTKSLLDVLKVTVVKGTFTGDREAAAALTGYESLTSITEKGNLLPEGEDTYTVVIYWEPSAADDDYNLKNGVLSSDGDPLFVDLGIKLEAAQDTVESDAFDNQYDKDAVPATDWYDNNPDAESFELATAAELRGLAAIVNSGKDDFAGKTIKLTADIDMTGIQWESIGNTTSYAGMPAEDETGNMFAGSFDGNGKTISNLTVTGEGGNVGFFGKVKFSRESVLTNVIFDGATVTGNHAQAVGVLAGSVYADGVKWVSPGGFDTDNVTNITVKNSTVVGSKYVGGVIGYASTNIVGVTVENTSVTALYDADYKSTTAWEPGTNDSGENAGGVVGDLYSNFNLESATVTGCTVKGLDKVGGIAGSSRSANKIADSTVTDLTIEMIKVDGNTGRHFGLVTGRVDSADGYTRRYTGNTATGTATCEGEALTVSEYAIP